MEHISGFRICDVFSEGVLLSMRVRNLFLIVVIWHKNTILLNTSIFTDYLKSLLQSLSFSVEQSENKQKVEKLKI